MDSQDLDGVTPLHVACQGTMDTSHRGLWASECVELLLEMGADPNHVDAGGESTLHKAAGRFDIIGILLKHGADLSAGDSNPLFSAIQTRDVHTVTAFLDAGASPNIMDAAQFDTFGNASEKKRTAFGHASGKKRTALEYAALHDCPDIVKLLIERGADVMAEVDNEQTTLLHYIFERAKRSVVSVFMDLAGRVDLNARDQQRRTALLAACDSHCRECGPVSSKAPIIRLLELGVDILAVDQNGQNALHHLAENTSMPEEAIFEFLQHDGCRSLLNQQDKAGFTPLQCALRTLRPLLCEKLIEMGSNLLEPDPFGQTALHHIASQYLLGYRPREAYQFYNSEPEEYYEGCRRLWRQFLALGGHINGRDHQGYSPFLMFLTSPVKGLLRVGDECCHAVAFSTFFADSDVDVFVRNNDGETALHLIARRPVAIETSDTAPSMSHDKTLFEFVLEKGLDPLAEDARGRSCLDVAAASGKREILDIFRDLA